MPLLLLLLLYYYYYWWWWQGQGRRPPAEEDAVGLPTTAVRPLGLMATDFKGSAGLRGVGHERLVVLPAFFRSR